MAASCFVALGTFAQLTITGTVSGEQDQPLAGANVVIESTLAGVTTNDQGKFTFKNLPPGSYRLLVSYVGYARAEYPVELQKTVAVAIRLKPEAVMAPEVTIRASRAGKDDPVSYTNLGRQQIRDENVTRDIPYLLLGTPSVVATSDAGTGVGYSALRIRGTDPSRINVTINGVPFNDPESHEVYWVDIPDILASTDNIQVQRGVGSSTQGAAAFGANINLQTLAMNPQPVAELNLSGGSFNTWKTSLNAGTGLIGGHFNMDVRLSKIHSDGYIDRAFTNLGSVYVSGGWSGAKDLLKATFFTGKERTYQAWGGVPFDSLKSNRTFNPYTYANEVDDYLQHNMQLHWSHQVCRTLDFSLALHYTGGEGFYEQYRQGEPLQAYLIDPVVFGADTVTESDLVRRKWLDNSFYGGVYSLNYRKEKLTLTAGGGLNRYNGDHFGRVIWARFASNAEPDHEYYRNTGIKTDANQFVKVTYQAFKRLALYADMQYRGVSYRISGIGDELEDVSREHRYGFFNPKAGVTLDVAENQKAFISYSIAHREPTRSNFIDAPAGQAIRPEVLYDLEAGYQADTRPVAASVTLYRMDYTDQLILTGQINDVGAPIMVNIPSSFRTGIETVVRIIPVSSLQVDLNLTLSRNKIRDFTEYVDDWDTGGQRQASLGMTDLALSPSVISGGRVTWLIFKGLRFVLDSRFVGRQYIDNTSDVSRSLDPYWVNNATLTWTVSPRMVKELALFVQANNFLNAQYETNAWVYSYYYEGQRGRMDGYFPQAGINFMAGMRVRL